jgi:hypothetical protein
MSSFPQEQYQGQGELDAFDYINESRYASAVSTPMGGPNQHQAPSGGGGQGTGYIAGFDGSDGPGIRGQVGGYGDENVEPWNRMMSAGRSGDIQQQHLLQPHHQSHHPNQHYSLQGTANHPSSADPGASLFVPFAQQRANRAASSIQGYSPEPLSARSLGNPMKDAQQDALKYSSHGTGAQSSHSARSISPNPISSQAGQSRVQPSSLSHYQQSSYEGYQGGNDPMAAAAYMTREGGQIADPHVHPINAGFGLPVSPEGMQSAYSVPYPNQTSHAQAPGHARLPTGEAAKDSSAPAKKQKKVDVEGNDGESNRPVVPPPVKNACLSCRTKKARCDGIQPICTQCSSKGRECVYVKSRRGGARRRKDKSSQNVPPPPPSALKEFLARLDGLQAPGGEPPELDSLSMAGGAVGAVDPATAVRSYASDDVDGM